MSEARKHPGVMSTDFQARCIQPGRENLSLRRQLANHPAHCALTWLEPFIEAALEAGVWPKQADSVRRELRAGLRAQRDPSDREQP